MAETKQIEINICEAETLQFSDRDLNSAQGRSLSAEVNDALTIVMDNRGSMDQAAVVKVDLSTLETITSAGLAELMSISRWIRKQGAEMLLTDDQQPVRQVFSLTRLERQFNFADTTDNAKYSEENEPIIQ